MYFKAGICSILKSIIRVLSHKSFLTFFCVVCIAYFNHRNYQSGHHIQKQCKTNTVSIRRIIHAKKTLDFILISELDNHETMYILSAPICLPRYLINSSICSSGVPQLSADLIALLMVSSYLITVFIHYIPYIFIFLQLFKNAPFSHGLPYRYPCI